MKILSAILIPFVLLSCGGDQGSSGDAETVDMSSEMVTDYQEKVSAKVSDSMVNSFVRDWGISEDEAKCLLDDIGMADLMRAESDPEVQARVRECGVDPAVIK